MKNVTKICLALTGVIPSAALADTYLGVNAGYFVDSSEPTLATHLGTTFAQSGNVFHGADLELLWTEVSEGAIDLTIVPLMLNYRAKIDISPSFAIEAGAGLGVAFNQLDYFGESDDDKAFAVQAFGGVTYRVTENFGLYAGARYLRVDETTLAGITADVGDDVSIEVGVRFGF